MNIKYKITLNNYYIIIMATSIYAKTIDQQPYFVKQSNLKRPSPKRGSRESSQQKNSRENSKETQKREFEQVNGMTLSQYLNQNQKYDSNNNIKIHLQNNIHENSNEHFKMSKSIELSQNEINYLMNNIYIDEVDEDLYSESHLESNH
jgi:hypothetical protein